MTYIIYKDGVEENRIVADKDFCEQYYSKDGYSYEEEPPVPASKPVEPPKTIVDLMADAYREGVNES